MVPIANFPFSLPYSYCIDSGIGIGGISRARACARATLAVVATVDGEASRLELRGCSDDGTRRDPRLGDPQGCGLYCTPCTPCTPCTLCASRFDVVRL